MRRSAGWPRYPVLSDSDFYFRNEPAITNRISAKWILSIEIAGEDRSIKLASLIG